MQEFSLEDEHSIDAFINTASIERFSRYVAACDGDRRKAVELYLFNIRLSQSLYALVQIWEIALRNKLNEFLRWKHNDDWPRDQRLRRNLTRLDLLRLDEATARQSRARNTTEPPTGAIVADLSTGFWVSLLGKSYEVPFSWRYNLVKVFPNASSTARSTISDTSRDLSDARNRIAHHESIFHRDPRGLKRKFDRQIADMCGASAAFANHACTFARHEAELARRGLGPSRKDAMPD